MRIDRMDGGRRLALSALGAAVVLCVAAWSGWGKGLPSNLDAVVLPALPQLPQTIDAGMAPLDEGSALLQRPLFHPSRRPQRYLTRSADDAGQGQPSLRLTGVIITPATSLATLSGEGGLSVRLRLGDGPVQGWQLLDLSPRQATVSGPQGVQTLLLTVHEASAADEAPARAVTAGPAPAASQPGTAPVQGAASPSLPQAGRPPEPERPAASANDMPEPSASQIQAIRERIQARRRQMQQANGSGQNTDGNP